MTADIQTHQSHDEFELRERKRGPFSTTTKVKAQDQDQDPDQEGEEGGGENYRVSRDQRNPSPSHTNGESTGTFRTLIATNTGIGNICLSLPSSSSSSSHTSTPDSTSSTTLFYITNGSLRRNTPSVTLSHGTKSGPVLGTLKLGFSRDNTFGIGDPQKDTEIAWENLRRTSEWTHGTYEFAYGGGREYERRLGEGEGDGERDRRRVYVWQRTRQRVFSDQPDMELREKLASGGVGEVLAVYKGNQGMMWKSRGQFSILKGLDRGKPGWSGKEGGEWSEFELVILLTGLGIIESSRRRARGRRGGGASGGGG